MYFFAIGLVCLFSNVARVSGASFSGNARLEVNDPNGGLSWNSANDALSVQAWFKIRLHQFTITTGRVDPA
jgi:hypothetical protein